VIAERYTLLELIAKGGSGAVWRARDEKMSRDVAVKVLRGDWASDPAYRTRLAYEARAVAAIDSPFVVKVFPSSDGEVAADDPPYVVMELITGPTLRDLIRQGIALDADTTAGILRDVASALVAVHAKGLIHRDVKPGNILICESGNAKLADFGIAHGFDSPDLTATGTLVGTAAYLAPEQVEGIAATPRSDIYALGVVAYECLVGAPPFKAETDVGTALMRLQREPAALPADVPFQLRQLVSQMLARDPENRPLPETVARIAGRDGIAEPSPTRTLVLGPYLGFSRTARRGFPVGLIAAGSAAMAAAAAAVFLLSAPTGGGGSDRPGTSDAVVDGSTNETAIGFTSINEPSTASSVAASGSRVPSGASVTPTASELTGPSVSQPGTTPTSLASSPGRPLVSTENQGKHVGPTKVKPEK
jgi:serine/threonine-protein kinase